MSKKEKWEMVEKPAGFEAKKDFEIHHNEVHIFIKKGDEISEKKVPKLYWENLRAEGVI